MIDVEQLLRFNPPADLLSQRVILVSGASGGLGSVIARSLAAHGATVILLGKTVAKLEALYDSILGDGSPEPAIYPFNLEGARVDDYADLQNNIAEHFGRLDGLVHAAAWLGAATPMEHFDAGVWAKVMQINLHAPFLLTRACIPLLQKGKNPCVLFLEDHGSRRAYGGAYGVSKAAQEGLADILATELEGEKRIRVNGIDPGPLRTPLRARAFPGEAPEANPRPEFVLPAILATLDGDFSGEHLRLQE